MTTSDERDYNLGRAPQRNLPPASSETEEGWPLWIDSEGESR